MHLSTVQGINFKAQIKSRISNADSKVGRLHFQWHAIFSMQAEWMFIINHTRKALACILFYWCLWSVIMAKEKKKEKKMKKKKKKPGLKSAHLQNELFFLIWKIVLCQSFLHPFLLSWRFVTNIGQYIKQKYRSVY